jgi:hypothetical protein
LVLMGVEVVLVMTVDGVLMVMMGSTAITCYSSQLSVLHTYHESVALLMSSSALHRIHALTYTYTYTHTYTYIYTQIHTHT